MIIRIKDKKARQSEQTIPAKWFAWYPVRVSRTEIAWLQCVSRRRAAVGSPFTYSKIEG